MNIKHILSSRHVSGCTDESQSSNAGKAVLVGFRGNIIFRYPGKRVLGGGLQGFQSYSTKGARGRVCERGSSSGSGPAPLFSWAQAGFGGILVMSILSVAHCAALGHAYVAAQMHTFL